MNSQPFCSLPPFFFSLLPPPPPSYLPVPPSPPSQCGTLPVVAWRAPTYFCILFCALVDWDRTGGGKGQGVATAFQFCLRGGVVGATRAYLHASNLPTLGSINLVTTTLFLLTVSYAQPCPTAFYVPLRYYTLVCSMAVWCACLLAITVRWQATCGFGAVFYLLLSLLSALFCMVVSHYFTGIFGRGLDAGFGRCGFAGKTPVWVWFGLGRFSARLLAHAA